MRARFLKSILAVVAAYSAGLTAAQDSAQRVAPQKLVYIEEGPVEKSVLYVDGREIDVPTRTVWRPICGSDTRGVTVEDLRRGAERARQASLAHPYRGGERGAVAGGGGGGLDIVFNITSALPPGAGEALAAAERYVEAQFSDPVTVVIDFSFADLGGGILGLTSSNYTVASWTNTRNGLQAGMDADDSLQSSLPAGSTIPVRYNGNSPDVTNEDRVFITLANFRAAIGSIGGTAAFMQMNLDFFWDYTPPDIEVGHYCFQSVIVHEIGHALGFTSSADSQAADMDLLDVYRFQRSDGSGTDYNPDSLAEFSTYSRLVDFNSPFTNDDSNSDLVTVEYQMSDGQPNQASHFTELSPGIYRMDPRLASQETGYPNFFRSGDHAMFDAIGWDYPPQNTTCPAAIPLQCGDGVPFDTQTNLVVPSPAYSCGSGTAHAGTMWFSFVASSPSTQISTCGSDGSDSTFAVYSGACGALTEIACAEDGGCVSKPGLSVVCLQNLEEGETYHVQVSSRTAPDRNVYTIRYDCECPGACCLTPPANCAMESEADCAGMGGAFLGFGVECQGDDNQDGIEDLCEQPRVKFSQLPTDGAEDSASNVDGSDFSPSVTVADDFTSDGRPIRGVRWWGSVLDAGVTPDGWLIGFHEPLVESGSQTAALGLYYCDASIVESHATPIETCDVHAVVAYEARLHDCCLVESSVDSRNGAAPAAREAFYGEVCFDYALSVQALAGRRYDRDEPSGVCIASPTGASPNGDFWGWHRTAIERGVQPALIGPSADAGGWMVGPMSSLVTGCGPSHAAFELVTTTTGGQTAPLVWDNGAPNDVDIFGSQYGGQQTDWLTVDDVDFPFGTTLGSISFVAEEESPFAWAGRVRLEVYPDDGSIAPDDSGGPIVGLWIPDDAGAVVRTALGPGIFFDRARYDITGLNLVMPPGRWWLGLAGDGGAGGSGRFFVVSSHSVPPNPGLFGSGAFLRAPSVGVNNFLPWANFLSGRQSDVAFSINATVEVDCNCNGIEDVDDIAATTSSDCNANGIPDECEYDCNANGIPDECDLLNQTAADCQQDGILDECDIFLGRAADVDSNGIPDLCCEVAMAPIAAGSANNRNRTIGINPRNAGRRVALRVRLASLQHPDPPNPPSSPPRDFSAFENTDRWVGPPTAYPEGNNPTPTFDAARLQCEPYFADWSANPVLYVYGPEVMPSSIYEVQAIEEECLLAGQPNYSPVLQRATGRWGDVVEPFQPPSENIQPDPLDVVGVVNKFKSLQGSPAKVFSMLQPAVLDLSNSIGALDIVSCIDAFRGFAYPYQGVAACPP